MNAGSAAMFLLIGATAGFVGGLVGLGGGIVMIPMLAGIAKFRQHAAHGTSLAALVATGVAGSLAYAAQGSVDIFAAVALAATATPMASVGARFAHSLPAWKLKRGFGAFLLFVAVLLIIKPWLLEHSNAHDALFRYVALLFAGGATGLVAGMMGVGGGAMMVPAMVLLAGIDQHTAQGTSLLAMVPAAIAGGWAHYKLGNVEVKPLLNLLPAIVIGAAAGGYAAVLIDANMLRVLFALVILYQGSRYLRAARPVTP